MRFEADADVEVDGAVHPVARVAFPAADPAAAVALLRATAFPRERPAPPPAL